MLFERNDIAFGRGKFRVRGDVVEVYPAYLDEDGDPAWSFSATRSTAITSVRSADRPRDRRLEDHTFFPAKQFVTPATS